MDDGFMDEHDVSMSDFGPTPSGGLQDLGDGYEYQMSLTPEDFSGGTRTAEDMGFGKMGGIASIPFIGPALDLVTPKSIPELLATVATGGLGKFGGTVGKGLSTAYSAINAANKFGAFDNKSGGSKGINQSSDQLIGAPVPQGALMAAPINELKSIEVVPDAVRGVLDTTLGVPAPDHTMRGASAPPSVVQSDLEPQIVGPVSAINQPEISGVSRPAPPGIDAPVLAGGDSPLDSVERNPTHPDQLPDSKNPFESAWAWLGDNIKPDPNPNFAMHDGGDFDNRPYVPRANVGDQGPAPELAAINPAAYESYFMGYDPDYDPYSAGFVAQPDVFGRREVVAESGGGVMNLRNQANQLAAQGRGGDTMLMHMRPDEVAGLASLGGVTRNPTTGLPEGFLLPALGAVLPGLMSLGGSSILGGALATGLGAGAGQALQSKIMGEEDPLKKGMVAGLTAGLGSAALGGFGKMFGGEVGGASNALTSQTAKELGTTEALKAGQRAGKMFPEVGSFANMDSKLMGAGDAAREALTVNPLTTAGILGGVGGAASDAYAMQNAGGMMPGEGTSSKSFRDPQVATPKTPRERTGLAQSGNLTSYGFGPEGLFFGEGVYAEDGGRPVARMDSGGFMRDLMYSKPRLSPFHAQSAGVQSSVQEASQNLGEAGQALQTATRQVQGAQGTLNSGQSGGTHGLNQQWQEYMGGKLGGLFGDDPRAQYLKPPQLDLGFQVQKPRYYKEEGGIASMPEGGSEEMQLKITQDAVDAVRGEHPEPEIAIESFVSFFGPEAFESLRRLVIQEEAARTMGKADGLVNGDDGGRDDIQRGTIDGDQELNISGGEYIFSADDVALLGDGNTEAGARRLDEARDNLRRTARGTTKRPAYMGEGAATEMFEEVMTG